MHESFSARFESLSDDDLHGAVRRLTACSNVALADLLAHLGEVEQRGIHRARACATLPAYCQYELRMSEYGVAYRRSRAARLVHEHPELHGMVARGELHLTGLLMVAPYLGGERHAEVLERARFRSKREIARLIAELDPKPEVPARIEPIAPAVSRPSAHAIAGAFAGPSRSLPEGDRPADWVPDERELPARELAEAEQALEQAWQARREAPPERPLRFKVQFTASQEYVELLEEAFDLLGFAKKATSLPELQLLALREFAERLRKRRTGTRSATRGTDVDAAVPAAETSVGEEPEDAPETAPGSAPERNSETAPPEAAPLHSRYITAKVRRAVWVRDAGRCEYVDDRERRCPERRGLEVHHRLAHAHGGPPTLANLELRCHAHNLLAAEQDFGREHLDRMRGRGGRGT